MTSSTFPQNSNNSHASDQDDAEILPLLLLLWSKKFLIVGLMLLGFLIGSLIASTKTPMYRADALIQLEDKNNGISLSQDITEMMSNESSAVTEIEILKSRMVLDKAVRELQLDIVALPRTLPLYGEFIAVTGFIPRWSWLAPVSVPGEAIEVESLTVNSKLFGSPLLVTTLDQEIYQVKTDDGQALTGRFGEILAAPDGSFQLNIARISARPGVEFVVRKDSSLTALNRLQNSVRVSEKGRNSGLLSITLEGPEMVKAKESLDQILLTYVEQNIGRSSEQAGRSLEFLNDQLPVVQADLTAAENDLNSFRLKHESINLDIESATVLERTVAIDTQISDLAMQEAELSRLYTKAHPRYLSLLDKQMKLMEEKETLSSAVRSFPETQQEILKRTRDLEVNQHIYMQLLNKKQELNVLKASNVGSVRIIDGAVSNPDPVSPNKSMIVFISAMLAAMCGCGVVLLRFFLERNVDSPDDITKLGLPVYATVPQSEVQDGQIDRSYMLARDNPSELAVEALRGLRTSLHFGMLEGGKGIVSITGPAPEIGKSFVAANLAYLAAESGANVLLIDADLRRGTIAKIFDIDNHQEGLSELLAGSLDLEQVIKPIALSTLHSAAVGNTSKARGRSLEPELEAVLEGIDFLDSDDQQTDIASLGQSGNLAVIPRGKAPPNPSELLMQDRLPILLREASQLFDLVIVDTPPVLAVTDAMILGRFADMNLMVVRHNKTRVREMEEVVRTFSVNSVELAGVILNGYDQKKGRFGQYGYAYGYQYQYESTE